QIRLGPGRRLPKCGKPVPVDSRRSRVDLWNVCLVNVHSAQHFSDTEFTLRPEATASFPFEGIPVGAKKHVPNGKVGIVEGVNTLLMMDAVALGSLKDVSKPTRRFHIPVIHQFGQAAQHDSTGGRSRLKATPRYKITLMNKLSRRTS